MPPDLDALLNDTEHLANLGRLSVLDNAIDALNHDVNEQAKRLRETFREADFWRTCSEASAVWMVQDLYSMHTRLTDLAARRHGLLERISARNVVQTG